MLYKRLKGRLWAFGGVVGRFTVLAKGPSGASDDYAICEDADIARSVEQAAL